MIIIHCWKERLFEYYLLFMVTYCALGHYTKVAESKVLLVSMLFEKEGRNKRV